MGLLVFLVVVIIVAADRACHAKHTYAKTKNSEHLSQSSKFRKPIYYLKAKHHLVVSQLGFAGRRQIQFSKFASKRNRSKNLMSPNTPPNAVNRSVQVSYFILGPIFLALGGFPPESVFSRVTSFSFSAMVTNWVILL
jgi:hypothetical protein